MGNIVLEGSPPPFTRTCSSRRPTSGKSRLAAPQPSTDAPPSSRTRGSKRKMSPPLSSATTRGEYVISNSTSSSFFSYFVRPSCG